MDHRTLARTWATTLQTAARRISQHEGQESKAPAAPAEIVGLVVALVSRVLEKARISVDGVDQRLRSDVGRRVLDQLRAEVVRGWAAGGTADADLPALMVAMEETRDAIQQPAEPSLETHLRGADGLELVRTIAHDLRSPLTSILFLAEALQRGQGGPVNDVQRRQLGLIYTAALGLNTVASDIIDVSRSEQFLEPVPIPFSVAAALEAVRDIVRPMAEEKQLALRIAPPPADQRLGHPVALSRVLLNLTTNALKFTDQGYVEVSTQELSTNRIEFSVRDSGRGMDPATVATLFDPLRRVAGRTGRLFSQTGLGLSICRKLVETMGSELKGETRLGWGTRFWFVLELPHCPSRCTPVPPDSPAPFANPHEGNLARV